MMEIDIVKTEAKNENFSIVSSKSKKSIICGSKSHKEYSFKPLINDDAMKKIREGWNLKNACDLTVGDLYLMFGSDSKLILEYKCIEVNESGSSSNGVCADVEAKLETNSNSLGGKLKNLLTIANLMENPNASFMTNISEKSLQNEIRDGGGEAGCSSSSTFKQPPLQKPYFDSYLRPSNPRLKPHQSKWWRNQQLYRYRVPSDGLTSNNFRNVGNHVIRNLYEIPSTSSSPSSNNNNEPDELTKTLEDKIQNIQSSPQIQNFSESSRSSIRSLLESLSSNKSNYDYGESFFNLTLKALLSF